MYFPIDILGVSTTSKGSKSEPKGYYETTVIIKLAAVPPVERLKRIGMAVKESEVGRDPISRLSDFRWIPKC
jgi:hypothetical protein